MMFWIVLRKELLSFFRDKNTIIYSIILPVALYPVIFWVMNQIIVLHQGSLSQMPSRIAFVETPPEDLVFQMLQSKYDLDMRMEQVDLTDKDLPDLKHLELDAVIGAVECGSDDQIGIFYDSSSDRSKSARDRIEEILNEYQIQRLFRISGVTEDTAPDIRLLDIDLSSRESRSRFILGILLPMIVVIITVMGGIHPSIEVITSERERKTLETTLSSPLKGSSLIAGKFLAVITMSTVAGILNIVVMVLTLRFTLFSGLGGDFDFSIPWSALPLMGVGIVLIAATFGAVMILIAAFAKDFKEAQSFVSPVYALGIQPAVVAAIPGIPFNSVTAWIPITNISLFFRALIQGNCELLPAVITLGSLMFWCIILLSIANKLLGRDILVIGLDKQHLKRLFSGKFSRKGV